MIDSTENRRAIEASASFIKSLFQVKGDVAAELLISTMTAVFVKISGFGNISDKTVLKAIHQIAIRSGEQFLALRNRENGKEKMP